MKKKSREKEQITKEAAKKKRNRQLDSAFNERERKTRELEFSYKIIAVLIPPIPPLVLALIVFFFRLRREKEGVIKTRLR